MSPSEQDRLLADVEAFCEDSAPSAKGVRRPTTFSTLKGDLSSVLLCRGVRLVPASSRFVFAFCPPRFRFIRL